MVQLPISGGPLKRIKNPGGAITISTAGKVLVIPTDNSAYLPSFNRETLNSNRLTIAESPFGGLKGSGAADYGVGTIYTATDGIYLTDKNGNNSTKTLTAGKLREVSSLTVDTSEKKITEEFIIKNDSTSHNPLSIETGDVAPNGWTASVGTGVTINSDSGAIHVSGNMVGGSISVGKSVFLNLSSTQFVSFRMKASATRRIRFSLKSTADTNNNLRQWANDIRFQVTTSFQTFVFPINTPAGTTGQNPNSKIGSPDNADTRQIIFGVYGTDTESIEFWFDDFFADVGKTANVEIDVPDNLNTDSSLTLQCWDGSAYQTCRACKLDSSFLDVSSTPANVKFLDATKVDDVYGSGLGRALFPKSISGATVNGSTGSMIYSGNKGTKYRIGLMVTLPPSDGGRTNFNKIRLKTILTYANSGATSYDFEDSNNASYGLQNMSRPFIALYDPAKNLIDFYLFTHRPKALTRRRNDSGEIYELVLYPGNGSIYHGQITHANLTIDSDSNLIPNCLESSIEGSVTKFLAAHTFWDDIGIITFTTVGATFAPLIEVTAGAKIFWTFDDGSTFTVPTPNKNFGEAGTHVTSLKVTPWSALTKINVGYDGADSGGYTLINNRTQQNVSKITGLQYATGLLILACNNNPITEIDLSGLSNLQYLEAYNATSLATVTLRDNVALKRLCIENDAVSVLNLSAAPHLEDIRGSTQAGGQITINWGSCGASLWHFCMMQETHTNPIPFYQFPVIEQLYCWTTGTNGAFSVTSTVLREIKSQHNTFTSVTLPDSAPNLNYVGMYDDHMTQAMVDYILEKVDGYGSSNGYMNISQNAAPSANGITHKNNLVSKGWTVTTD